MVHRRCAAPAAWSTCSFNEPPRGCERRVAPGACMAWRARHAPLPGTASVAFCVSSRPFQRYGRPHAAPPGGPLSPGSRLGDACLISPGHDSSTAHPAGPARAVAPARSGFAAVPCGTQAARRRSIRAERSVAARRRSPVGPRRLVGRLSDGSAVEIRELVPADRALVQEAFARLSPRSRYMRFLSPFRRCPVACSTR
jgi:hypothetical protein